MGKKLLFFSAGGEDAQGKWSLWPHPRRRSQKLEYSVSSRDAASVFTSLLRGTGRGDNSRKLIHILGTIRNSGTAVRKGFRGGGIKSSWSYSSPLRSFIFTFVFIFVFLIYNLILAFLTLVLFRRRVFVSLRCILFFGEKTADLDDKLSCLSKLTKIFAVI